MTTLPRTAASLVQLPGHSIALSYIVAALWLLSFGYTEMAGSDLWWHLAAGREILQQQTLWLVDTWSFTAQGDDWANHEWLADLIFHAWVSLWGLPSLVYWKWLLVVTTFLLLLRALHPCGDSLAALLLSILAAAVAAPFLDLRPQLYTFLCFTALLNLYRQGRPPLWQLLLLFLVWVNLHGGFFFGLMAAAIYEVPWRARNLASFRKAVLRTVCCAAVCLLNPDGFKVLWLPLVYAFDGSSPYRQLGEWLNPFRAGGIRSPLFFWLLYTVPAVLLAYAFPFVRRRAGLPWAAIVLSLLSFAMALTSRRFVPLAGMAYALVTVPLVSAFLTVSVRKLVFVASCVVLAVVAVWRLSHYPLRAAPAFHYLSAEYTYPHDLVDFSLKNQLGGKVFAYYNWGGYLHWRSDGIWQVYIDGRANTVYGDETYRSYIKVLLQKPGWQQLVNDSDASYVLWPRYQGRGQNVLQGLLATGQWQLVYRDAVGFLLARKSLQLPRQMQAADPGPYRDLTAAHEAANVGKYIVALDYARRVRRVLPWQLTACSLEAQALRALQRPEPAQTVVEDCLRQFPTAYLH